MCFLGKDVKYRNLRVVSVIFIFTSFLFTPDAKVPASNVNEINPLEIISPDLCRIETLTLEIPQLGNRHRTIIICLPSEYDISDIAYPVVYLQGAQDVFTRSHPTSKEWDIDADLYEFYIEGFSGHAILVAVEYDRETIWDEYSPWVNQDMYSWIHPLSADQVEGGEGDAYIDFIINTLKPKIDNLYRTLPDREHTGIGGGTMGGLISVYAGLTRPDVFSRVIAMSPCVWFAENGGPWLSNNQLLNQIKNLNLPQDVIFHFEVGSSKKTEVMELQPAVYDLLGNRITYEQAYAEGTKALVKALVNGAVPIENIKGEDQNSVEWVECIEQPFNWLLLEQARTDNLVFLPIIYKPNTIESPSRIETFTISMAPYFSYQEQRTIQVYLPPNYDTSGKSYPVIYIQDGQQLFNPTAIGDWLADETLDRLYYEGKTEGFIVVAISAHSELKERWDEYWIWTNDNMYAWVLESMADEKREGGEGIAYVNFITNKLKYEIDSRYRTLKDKEHTAIGGSSMGALISIYAGLAKPDVFSKVMAMSTAVWFAEGHVKDLGDYYYWLSRNQLIYYIDNEFIPYYEQKYYFYVGTNEYSSPELMDYPICVKGITCVRDIFLI